MIDNQEKVSCPDCGGNLVRRGNKKRTIIHEDGSKQIFSLKRYYCEVCKKTHTEIPEFIVPYKHYHKEVIEKVKGGNTETFCGDDSTIRRWKADN